ncbi:MAG: YncE family protein [Gemmatimonadota bacterium]
MESMYRGRFAPRPAVVLAAWTAFACTSGDAELSVAGEAGGDGPFAVESTIEVGAAPHGIRFSGDGDTAYVALSGDGQIAVVDLTRSEVVAKWEAGATPLDLIATAGGWLITQFTDSTLLRLDREGNRIPGGVVEVGPGPSLFTPGSVRDRVWVTLEFADRLVEVDLSTSTVTASLETGDRPYPGAAMWDGSHVFVPNLEDGTVTAIDVLNRETDGTTAVCPGPPGGALTPDMVTYVVACGGSDEVVLMNTASFEVVGRVTDGLGPRPFSATVTSDGRYAVVNNAGGTTVSIVDLDALTVVQQIEVGEQPIVVRAHPDGRRVLVANEVSGTLVVLVPAGAYALEADAGASDPGVSDPGGTPNEVIVIGTIHGEHETSDLFSLDVLSDLVREIDPDYWMVEISPARWPTARDEFAANGRVDEPRVRRFPEYIGGLFPLSRELDFEVIPTAGWTRPMSDFRAAHLQAVSEDPSRTGDWAEYQAANAAADSAIRAGGEPDDPRWINTDAYDDAYELRLATYNRIFNEELGPGGWDNINVSHYANIARALDEHRGEGARFLITYGAGHKGWFLRALRERDDIVLLDVGPFLDAIGRP